GCRFCEQLEPQPGTKSLLRVGMAGVFRSLKSGRGSQHLEVSHGDECGRDRERAPIRVATWAKGISSMRPAAVRITMKPVPPSPLSQAFTMAVSIGYMSGRRPPE